MLKERTVINECYILQKRIGEDSLTEHWIATAIFSATRFLLRFIKNNDNTTLCLDALRSDAMRCYRVRGDFIADFVEVEYFGKQIFISSEYHDEKPLLTVLQENVCWPLDHICFFIITLARALESFHDQGIIYGNLNAENVLVKQLGENTYSIKIQKPGLLSLLPCLPNTGQDLLETYGYISPEYKTNRQLSEGSDVYSLGIHLVRFFTGSLPYPDDGNSVVTNSASLRFATNALLRRGIPEALVRIILHALMSDPSRRYRSCIDLIRDLRIFMEESEIKNRDSDSYFKTSDVHEKESEIQNETVFPRNSFVDKAAIEKLEKQERIALPEESLWSIDDYIAQGQRAVSNEKGLESIVPIRFRQNEAFSLGDERPLPPGKGRPDGSPSDLHNMPLVRSQNVDFPLNQIQSLGIDSEKTNSWNYVKVRFQDVAGIVSLSAKRANKGKGIFRYIQEPQSPELNAELFHSLESLRKECLYIHLGSCARFGKATSSEFFDLLRHAIARELSRENPKFLKSFAKRISEVDTFGVFKSAPLGRLLYGVDAKETKASLVKTKECRESIVISLAGLARKKRPLVLVIRGGEHISKDLHAFFSDLARGIHEQPICVLVFFEHAEVESWHALATLQ